MSAGPDPPYVTTTGAHPEPNGSETVGATCSIPLNCVRSIRWERRSCVTWRGRGRLPVRSRALKA